MREEQGRATTPLDKFKNPVGAKFDLGRNNAFGDFHVLIGLFINRPEELPERQFFRGPIDEIGKKGFNVDITKNERDFLRKLNQFPSVAIVISSDSSEWDQREKGERKRQDLAGTFGALFLFLF